MPPHNSNSLFLPKKPNGKRPYPDPSTSSRVSHDNRSPPPAPSYSHGSAPNSSTSFTNRTRPPIPPPPPPAPLASSSRNNSLSSSSTSSHQHALQSRGLSLQSPSSPFPSNIAIDEILKQKLESISTQFLQLFKLQSQSLENLSSSSQGGTFEASDLGPEDAEELKRLWNDGLKKLNEKDKREREALGSSIVEGLGGLLAGLVEKVGGDTVERRIGDLRRQIELLRSNSSAASTSNSGVTTVGSAPTPATLNRSDPSLSEALSRIRTLEQKLAQSDQERLLLKKELKEKDDKFEQRLNALENRTTDPRRRVSSAGGATNGPSSSSPVPLQDTKQQLEIDGLRKEVEELRVRVAKAENGGSRKRTREEEDERELEKERFKKLQGQVGDHEIKLRDTRGECEELQEKIVSLDLPSRDSPSHPTQLFDSLLALSQQISTFPRITELESSLLRGIHEFLSLTKTSTTPIESFSPEEVKTLLRDTIFNIHSYTEKAKERMREFEKGNEKHTKQLKILWEKSKEMKPLLEYFEKLFRKAFPNESAEAESTPDTSVEARPTPATNGISPPAPAARQAPATTSTSGDQSMAMMEESEEDDGRAAAAVARQLGVNGTGSSTFNGVGGGSGQTTSHPSVATTNGSYRGFAHESDEE
ncbi:hypothetical protein JCM3765_004087 [Sporobolomyces pararoseus]